MGANSNLAFRRIRTAVLSLIVLVIAWQIISVFVDPEILPGPKPVFAVFMAEAKSGEMAFHLTATLLRVITAFVLAKIIGSAIGIALGLSSKANRFFDPWIVLLLNFPALVIIVLAYIWFGLNEVAAIGAVAVNKVPNVVVTLREGARALDKSLLEMGQAFQLNRRKMLTQIILPQLQPFFAAASRSGISLIWKIVLVVELLGRPNGIGFQIHLYFQLFDVASILAYALTFVCVMMVIELVVIQPLEHRASRWRKRDA